MKSDIASQNVYSDFQGLAKLRREAKEQSPESIRQVSRQFESMFIQMVLQSMRDATPESGLFDSEQGRMFQDMYDKQLGVNLAQGEGIGLAKVIERQLSGNTQVPGNTGKTLEDYRQYPVQAILRQQAYNETQTATAPESAAEPEPVANADKPTASVPAEIRSSSRSWDTPESFIRDSWPHAVKAAEKLGVDPRVLIAQSALETGWGKHVARQDDGQSSHSLFGIKADRRWSGDHVTVNTLEFRSGAMERERAQFRSYSSIGEAYMDYADFLRTQPRYRQVLEHAGDASRYIDELQKAGYATDPDYARKIKRIHNSDLLNDTISQLMLHPGEGLALKTDANGPIS